MDVLLKRPEKAGPITTEFLFDWRADLERLEAAAETARSTHDADPWMLAEGECWLDLIAAELAAVNHAPKQPGTGQSRLLLEDWRRRTLAAVQTLRAVASSGAGWPGKNRLDRLKPDRPGVGFRAARSSFEREPVGTP